MIIIRQIMLAIIFTPLTAEASKGFIDLGFGDARSNFDQNNLTSISSLKEWSDNSGNVKWLRVGKYFTKNISLGIEYMDFGTTLSAELNSLKQSTYLYGISFGYDVYQSNKFSLIGTIGYGNWNSKVIAEKYTLSGSTYTKSDIERKESGYTPGVGIGMTYAITDQVLLGFKYDHYFQLGDSEFSYLVDREILRAGDILGSLFLEPPVKFDLDAYSIFFRVDF